jgi:hypothetical protein
VFGCDLLQDNVEECRERLLALVRSKLAAVPDLPARTDLWFRAAIRHQVFRADALKFDFQSLQRFDQLPSSAQGALMLDRIPKLPEIQPVPSAASF